MEMTEERINKFKEKGIIKKMRIGALSITFKFKSKDNFMGRFGGGWNWKLGFQAGGKTIIFNLLICSLIFNFEEKSHVKI